MNLALVLEMRNVYQKYLGYFLIGFDMMWNLVCFMKKVKFVKLVVISPINY